VEALPMGPEVGAPGGVARVVLGGRVPVRVGGGLTVAGEEGDDGDRGQAGPGMR
jgi:hypothetical protein